MIDKDCGREGLNLNSARNWVKCSTKLTFSQRLYHKPPEQLSGEVSDHYLNPSMTSEPSRLSLMRPVSRGGEPSSSITVTWRRSNPQSAFWWKTEETDFFSFLMFVKLPQNLSVLCGDECSVHSRFPHLNHDVLQLCSRSLRCWAQTGSAAASSHRTDPEELKLFSHRI